ncbi:MAG: double zinc ribbon domain-containing protein [Syntrophothermus sp.]
MALAIFGIKSNGLDLAATLFVLMLVVLWLALIVYTYFDARRRIADPFLVGCATLASFFPYIGTAVYAIVRPPEYLEDAHERELEIKAAELRVRQLKDQTCPNCEYQIEKSFLRCPNCQRRLKDPCPACGKPVDPRWALCPYCETALGERRRPAPKRERRPEARDRGERPERAVAREAPPKRQPQRRKKASARAKDGAGAGATKTPEDAPEKATAKGTAAAEEPSTPIPEQRSPSREPDPDTRQA